jgi:hypothetical protein
MKDFYINLKTFNLSPDLWRSIINDFLQFEGYLPKSKIKLKSLVIALQVTILLYLIDLIDHFKSQGDTSDFGLGI